jgi:hypothetical protein
MGAFIALALLALFFGLWAVELVCVDDDADELERYEAQREAFERMFK